MKKFLAGLGQAGRTTVAAVAALFLAAGIAQAATTISTNMETGGTLKVYSTASFGATATTTITSAGAVSMPSTLSVTGLTSLIQASSTRFSVHDTAYFGGSATTTINSAGNVSVAGTLDVTGATTLASTTATGFKVGQTGTRLTRATAGWCTTDASAINASTTTMLTCTPSGGTGILGASDRVFVMATSSLPGRVHISAASSTSAGTIQVNVFNTGIDAGNVSSAVYSFNFWAFQ